MQSPRIPARTQLSGRYNPTTPVIDPPSVFIKFRRHSGRRAIRALPICPETHRGTGHPLLIFPGLPVSDVVTDIRTASLRPLAGHIPDIEYDHRRTYTIYVCMWPARWVVCGRSV